MIHEVISAGGCDGIDSKAKLWQMAVGAPDGGINTYYFESEFYTFKRIILRNISIFVLKRV